jgi:DNA-directed RNA polymerase-3 subunit RPC5
LKVLDLKIGHDLANISHRRNALGLLNRYIVTSKMDSELTEEHDELVSVLPIHFSDALAPNIHIHQFPLLTRPLQEPPTALLSGKRITARIKPQTRRLEIHVPVDTRPEVCNLQKSKELGAARADDDREKNQDKKEKREDGETRLSETRLKSEEITHKGVQVLGIVRDGEFHCYVVDVFWTHVFRQTTSASHKPNASISAYANLLGHLVS